MNESQSQHIDLREAVSDVLNNQLDGVRKLIIACAVPNWFDHELIQLMIRIQGGAEIQPLEVLTILLDLGLAQPFRDIGYAFHEDVRNILLSFLETGTRIRLHEELVDFFAQKLESGENARLQDIWHQEIAYQACELGAIYVEENSSDIAQRWLLRAVDNYRAAQDQQGVGEAKRWLGRAYLRTGGVSEAEATYSEAAKIAQSLNDERKACDLLRELGNSLAAENAWDAAVKAYEKRANLEVPGEEAEERRSRIEDLASVWARKADWHRLNHEWQRAGQAYRKAEYLYNMQGNIVVSKQMRDNIVAMRKEKKQNRRVVSTVEVLHLVSRHNAILPANAFPKESRNMFQHLRIFISSTTQDLQSERDAVEQAIAGLHLEAVRSETVGSQSISPREACRIMAQQCDIYLGILGGRYGFTLNEGISATEFEFNTTREAGKPILLYRKEVPEDKLEAGQKAFIERLGDFDTGYYIHKFTALDVPDQLCEQVQQDIQALLSGAFRDRMPEVRLRPGPPSGRRTLIASLGRAPGAVTGLYHALKAIGKPVDRVLTVSTSDFRVKRAVRVVREEMEKEGVVYHDESMAAVDIASDNDAREFKDAVYRQLKTARGDGDEACIGIAGGRTVMGALLALVAQLAAPEGTLLYQISVPDDIFEDGQIPNFFNLPAERQREVLQPPDYHLVPVPFVRFEGND
jgi:CRISPR-associated Csx14 family protein